ncbi:MAG: tetratricopeptide repeat protein [Lentisphaerota bacterium]
MKLAISILSIILLIFLSENLQADLLDNVTSSASNTSSKTANQLLDTKPIQAHYVIPYNKIMDYEDSARAEDEKGNFAGAIQNYNKIIDLDSRDGSAYSGRGEMKESLGDYEGARQDYTKAIEVEVSQNDAMRYKKQLDVLMTEKYAKMRPVFSDDEIQAAQAKYDLHLTDNEIYACDMSSASKARAGDYRGAIRDLTRAIEASPNPQVNRKFYCNRGRMKEMLGDNPGAMQDYAKGGGEVQMNALRQKLGDYNVDAYLHSATKKLYSTDSEGAIQDYTKAIELDPNNAEAYLLRGVAKNYLRDYIGVIQDSTEVIKLTPKNSADAAKAYIMRGKAKEKINDKVGALEDLSIAAKLGLPSDDLAKLEIRRIQNAQ